MATTTLQELRRGFSDYLGYSDKVGLSGDAWTTTSNIGAGATVTSTELRDAGFDDLGAATSGDDLFQGFWVLLLGTNNSGTERLIKSYDASAGSLTVAGTNLSSESGDTDFELHKFRPTELRELLNTARRRGYPALHMPVTKTLFSGWNQVRYEVPSAIIDRPNKIYVDIEIPAVTYGDNILSNAGFETFASSAFTSWSAESGITVSQETATTTPQNYGVFRDQSAAKLINGSSGTKRDFDQTISSPSTHSGQRINLSVWVYCLESGTVTTKIETASDVVGTTGGGGMHGGTGWEFLTQTFDATITLSTLKVGVAFATGAAANLNIYVDDAVCVVGPTQEPEFRGQEIFNWDYAPIVQGTTLRNEVILPYSVEARRRLRFEGRGYLSSMSAEADTIEIGEPETQLLYAHAALMLYERMDRAGADQGSEEVQRVLNRARGQLRQAESFTMPFRPRVMAGADWGR